MYDVDFNRGVNRHRHTDQPRNKARSVPKDSSCTSTNPANANTNNPRGTAIKAVIEENVPIPLAMAAIIPNHYI